MTQNAQKPLLSLRDVRVRFNVRGRILTAIRGVSLDIYDGESIAIVGESGSGKSVLTKTFAGMLDSNGFIDQGTIIFNDEELSETNVVLTPRNKRVLEYAINMLNRHSVLERGAAEYRQVLEKKAALTHVKGLTVEEEEQFSEESKEIKDKIVEITNYVQTLDRKNAADSKEIHAKEAQLKELSDSLHALNTKREALRKTRADSYQKNASLRENDKKEIAALLAKRREKIAKADNEKNPSGLTDAVIERNRVLAYEILLSIGRYPLTSQLKFLKTLSSAFKQAMMIGEDLQDDAVRNRILQTVAFRVEFRSLDEKANMLRGYTVVDCSKIKYTNDWQLIRGRKIATVFQDPMTSLNPVITIGKQIMNVVQKHQHCTAAEARERTISIMGKVGIPDPEKRFDDYPFQYSGGMRQRIVIAIALSCQPRILICDEPTTALDVTIQAQILKLIKNLQKDLGFTIVYITHDLGVVASVADRVAVLYAGQIVELGTAEDIFFNPKHPYTWALLSSMPQLSEKNEDLFSIPGTPPSLYNKVVGDAFAPRSQYAMDVDRFAEPPMFQVSETHFAKTWLLDLRAPKQEPPKNIQNLHEKMTQIYVNTAE